MPRLARIRGAHRTYHIIMRGKENGNIYLSDSDKEKFLEIIIKAKSRYNFILEAYCIMDNHTHLILNCNDNNITNIMKSINISYAAYFNKKNGRTGTLMHDRYISDTLNDIDHILCSSAHIHINPVKAGYADLPENYPWSSYKAYILPELKDDIVDCSRVLEYFSSFRDEAAAAYKAYTDEFDYPGEVLDIKEDKLQCARNIENYMLSYEMAEKYVESKIKENNTTYEQLRYQKDLRLELVIMLRRNSSLTMKEIGQLVGNISHSTVDKILHENLFKPKGRHAR